MNLTLYYDHEPDGTKRPLWISVDTSEVNWDEPVYYVNCSAYDTCDVYSFFDDVFGLSIHLEELVINYESKRQFGIDLERLKHRIGEEIDPGEIERFMVQVVDVVEVLNITL